MSCVKVPIFQMICRAYGLYGMIALPLISSYSFRYYDKKGQGLPLPFAAYAGNLLGRASAAWLTGRWEASLRDVTLGNLPSKEFLRPSTVNAADE